MKITIIYDNETIREDLIADWGFSCLVEAHGQRILFDTGANGDILLGNMKTLGIDPQSIHRVVISPTPTGIIRADWLRFSRKTRMSHCTFRRRTTSPLMWPGR